MLALVAAALLNAAPFDPEAAFGRLPYLTSVKVAPGGDRLAARYSNDGKSGLLIYEMTKSGINNRLIGESDNLKIRDFDWKRDDRLIIAASVPGVRYGTPTLETRLLAVTPGKEEIDRLFRRPKRSSGELPVQIQDRIVSLLPHDPKHILVEYAKNSENIGLYEVDVDKRGRHSMVEGPRGDSRRFIADMQGTARARMGFDNGTSKLFLKMPNDKWKDFSHRVAKGQPRFVVVGFPNTRSKAFVLSDHATPNLSLYLFDIEADEFESNLYSHPTSDVSGIRQRLSDGAAYGAFFAEDDVYIHYFGENLIKDLTTIVENSVDADDVSYQSMNPQETMAVYWAASDGGAGRYYILDIENVVLTELPPLYPELEGVALGKVIATHYEARDGLSIPAFVTLPPGVASLEAAKNLPFMLLPHGGPNARDYVGFDWWAQYLAHKGYGVLQMNFRGSTGYGAEFRDAGNRQWGQAMQDDITDGANWLISGGHADADRIGIMGASYGGYAALMGTAKTPDLFTCAVAVNGVSSLPQVIADEQDYVDGKYSTRHIGRLWGDRRMLRENSPRFRAEEISVPVLLIASEDDRVVPDNHSTRMHNAIQRAGGRSELVVLPEGSHNLNVGTNRVTALRAIGGFLDQCRRS
ncbi:MAG: prolyl oligopeptidase family serine peptidase [Pseudomonadota bacterium]